MSDPKLYDVVALGELLVDFLVVKAPENPPTLRGDAGGAPANVLAASARLGGRTAFIGMVGRDAFGNFLAASLMAHGIDVSGLCDTDEDGTTLAFVRIGEDGERHFSFARNPGADTRLTAADVDESMIAKSRTFHFGSLSMTTEPARSATWHAVRLAKAHGVRVSFDPNWRDSLWSDRAVARELLRRACLEADVVKVSEEEALFLTGAPNVESGLAHLVTSESQLVVATCGERGCLYCIGERTGCIPSPKVEAVDTTGAGDAFLGSLLLSLAPHRGSLVDLPTDSLESYLATANRVGAWTASHLGTMSAFPTRVEVDNFP